MADMPDFQTLAGAAQIVAELAAKRVPEPGNALRTIVALSHDLFPDEIDALHAALTAEGRRRVKAAFEAGQDALYGDERDTPP